MQVALLLQLALSKSYDLGPNHFYWLIIQGQDLLSSFFFTARSITTDLWGVGGQIGQTYLSVHHEHHAFSE